MSESERAIGHAPPQLDRIGRGTPQEPPQNGKLGSEGVTFSDPGQGAASFGFHAVQGSVDERSRGIDFGGGGLSPAFADLLLRAEQDALHGVNVYYQAAQDSDHFLLFAERLHIFLDGAACHE
jgi:hypothetical protein